MSDKSSWPEQSLGFGAFYFSYYSFVGVFPTYITLYLAFRGIDAFEIGVLMSLMQAMRIVGPNLWGWMADWTGQRARVLQFTAASALVAFTGFFFGGGFWYFAFFMIAVNLFTSAQGPLSDALILAEMKGNMSRYGQLRLWGSVGYVVMTAASGFVLDWTGIGLMPWVGAVILGTVLLVSLKLYQVPRPVAERERVSVLEVLFRRDVAAFMVSGSFMLAAHSALYAFYSLYLSRLGYTSVTIGLMWAIGATAEIVFFIYQGPVVKRFGIKAIMLASLLAAVVRFALIGAGAGSFIVLLLAQLLHAATFGAHHVASILSVQKWFSGPLQARGQALFISVSYGIGGTLGGFLLSWVWDILTPASVYWVASALALAAFLAAWLSFRWQGSK
ncbi:MFS transporter [Oxalobacter aliiformigenes]|uniref:MFS transporter n=1 Tax=Oxalobacter aliiformigenes TaxID=2946593 RepID=UPI0022B039BB|nr:MFS transporter [Oxalobacter aliiformigenes]MCZ4063880.1 MFS transporter [Oxalobacter aliiformigenes]WAV98503.1 MFS transporter [Oxalobacter aliiformigenes]